MLGKDVVFWQRAVMEKGAVCPAEYDVARPTCRSTASAGSSRRPSGLRSRVGRRGVSVASRRRTRPW
eukprot:4363057-Lingulodinium_polyedra.AAC.1